MLSRRFMLLVVLASIAAVALALPVNSQNVGKALSYDAASVSITNVSLPGNISINSPLAIFATLENTGGIATGNVTLNMKLVGISNSLVETYNVEPLSPSQSESVVLLIYNKTTHVGLHTVTLSAAYESNGSTFTSIQKNVSYYVLGTQNQQEGGPSLNESNDLAIEYIPLYVSMFAGSSSVYQLGLKNTGSSPESINVSTDRNYSNFIELSTNSLYLLPNSTLYVQFLLKAPDIRADASTYYIPINLNTTYSNGTTVATEEVLALTIYNSSMNKPTLLNTITATNSTSSISGRIEIYSGANYSINNATLVTYLPVNSIRNSTKINTYGLNANVSKNGDSYEIKWFIQYLPAGQVTYGYYQINAPGSAESLLSAHSILSIPSMLKPRSVLRVVDLYLPTFYTQSTENISVSVLYTGISSNYVYFYVTAPSGSTVLNPTQSVLATPNELINKDFTIETSNTPGTMIFTLYVNTQDANITYSLPIIVLQGSSNTTSIQSENSLISGFSISPKDAKIYLVVFGGILLVVLLIYGTIITTSKPKYSAVRAKRLKNIKEQVKE